MSPFARRTGILIAPASSKPSSSSSSIHPAPVDRGTQRVVPFRCRRFEPAGHVPRVRRARRRRGGFRPPSVERRAAVLALLDGRVARGFERGVVQALLTPRVYDYSAIFEIVFCARAATAARLRLADSTVATPKIGHLTCPLRVCKPRCSERFCLQYTKNDGLKRL